MAKAQKIAILGSGNIGMSLARGLVKAEYCKPKDITLTRRTVDNLSAEASQGFNISNQNSEVVANSELIILAVLPQQLDTLLGQINGAIDSKRHVVISVISGVSCANIKAKLGEDVQVIRVMPNTAIAIGQSMTCIASDNASAENISEVTKMFETVGAVIKINEDLMTSATALCACGVAFFLRAIRAASQGGIEIGFHADEALKMAVQTAKGAADLLLLQNSHPEHEIDKVTSPKGCTIAGLNEMEHQGFSSSLIKGIKLSAQKAGDLYTKG
ncbi:pyrroline-5-carboxylate reductase [Daejeonella lutea]|uniref:Pyrroline-5-carboxylate reductase n=1 Tax=Daejeonella lutea TaxID=572036 RepID=A0A1T5DAF6_9SPHI|nr:pyrroline-5-carboxylate reductase [Daejeonella lutea]SKB68655.1 pyrroline-5-carboxylate reductase [Daejeonella lutea]